VNFVQEGLYDKVKPLIHIVETFSLVSYQSVYLIDYYRQNFLYVSENPLFLCGRTAKEVKELGYAFYIKNAPEEEQKMLVEINRAGFQFFDSINTVERNKYSISYDFHLLNDGKKILVNHKLIAFLLTDDGKIWIAMCVVSLSSHKFSGHVEFHINEIAYRMCKSKDSIKFYRHNLFEKLNVANIKEALAHATVYKLI